MASPRDLTTRQAVKSYRSISDTGSDAQIDRLITAMSAAFAEETGCEALRQSYTEVFDGDDERIARARTAYRGFGFVIGYGFALMPNRWPLINVAGVRPVITVDDIVIPRRTVTTGTGWVLLRDYRVELIGYDFGAGIANAAITYDAGVHVPAEPVTVPAVGPFTVTALAALGTFVSDIGVTKVSDGTVLTKVASGPVTGQYSVDSAGLYTFAAADANLALTLAYAYLPKTIEDCVIEMVSYKMDRRTRLDQVSANIGGQTASFSRGAWPATIQQVLDRWERPSV